MCAYVGNSQHLVLYAQYFLAISYCHLLASACAAWHHGFVFICAWNVVVCISINVSSSYPHHFSTITPALSLLPQLDLLACTAHTQQFDDIHSDSEEDTEELRATNWEEGLQRGLLAEEVTEELNHRRVQHQEVMQRDASSLQLEDVNKQLKTEFTKPLETLITTCDELEDAEKQLEVTPCDLSVTWKELEEVCFTINTIMHMYASLNCEWTYTVCICT